VALDNLNLELEQGMAQADYDLQNSPLYINRREGVCKQLASNKQNRALEAIPFGMQPLLKVKPSLHEL
jgi:hypothetical protein